MPRSANLLRAATLDVQVPDEGRRLEACGAARGAIAWTTTDVPDTGCRPALRIVDLKLARDGVAVEVNGLGFVAEDGEAAVLPLQKITDNPLISIVIGSAYAGLAAWAGRLVMRKRAQPAAAPDSTVVS